jgi:hypothetical protein
MHTEHLQNVKVGRVVAGWLVAVAVTSLVLVVFAGFGLLDPEGATEGLSRSFFAVAVGFFVGGWFVAARALAAPILHGSALGLMSIIGWFLINTVIDGLFPSVRMWEALTLNLTLAVLGVQIVVAVIGALLGYNIAVRGRLSLSDSAPEGE